jgi:hypothetical protein
MDDLMPTLAQFTVQWTRNPVVVNRVLTALGGEILFDEYPAIPDVEAAFHDQNFRCIEVSEDGVIHGVVLCVNFELHTLFLPSLRGGRAMRAGREVLRWLWENTEAPVLRSYFYSHQPHVGRFARLMGFIPKASNQPPLHVNGEAVYRTDLILNRPS